MLGLSSTIRMPAITSNPISCLSNPATGKHCRYHASDLGTRFGGLQISVWCRARLCCNSSAVAEFTNPLFQDHLVIRLDPRKNNSNVTVPSGIGNLTERRERSAIAGDSDSQLGSREKGLDGSHSAAIQTQIGDSLLNPKVRCKSTSSMLATNGWRRARGRST